MSANRTCAGCRWWTDSERFATGDQTPLGHCHDCSPVCFQMPSDGKLVSRWPMTAATDFCGDFQPREEGGDR